MAFRSEVVVLEVELGDSKFAPDVHVLVYDWDVVGTNDFLGRFSVPVSKLSEKLPEPTWYPLYFKDPKESEGEVLACFQL
jgi:hypothetical protein